MSQKTEPNNLDLRGVRMTFALARSEWAGFVLGLYVKRKPQGGGSRNQGRQCEMFSAAPEITESAPTGAGVS